jgi:hypothetical protein
MKFPTATSSVHASVLLHVRRHADRTDCPCHSTTVHGALFIQSVVHWSAFYFAPVRIQRWICTDRILYIFCAQRLSGLSKNVD